MARGASKQFPSEVIQRFLALYVEKPTNLALEQLAKEFPAVAKAGKPVRYWNQIAWRCGIKKKELGSFPVAPEPKAQTRLPLVELLPESEPEIRINNPDVAVPNHFIFGGFKIPLAAIREYRDALLGDSSAASVSRRLRERFPSMTSTPENIFTTFFKLRLGLSTRTEIVEIVEEDFDHAIVLQLRKQLVMDLFAQKWREAAIVEKTVELFPDIEPLETSEVKTLVSHRRQTRNAHQARRRPQNNDEAPKEPCARKVTSYSVRLVGPDLNYSAELSSREQAKTMLKALLEL
jgi:hypothetical protein